MVIARSTPRSADTKGVVLDLRGSSASALSPLGAGAEVGATVTSIDLRSVGVAAAFFAAGYAVFLAAAMFLWLAAMASGLIGRLESFVRDLGFDHFRVQPVPVFGALAGAGLVVLLAATAATAIGVSLYNHLAPRRGGISVRLAFSDPTAH